MVCEWTKIGKNHKTTTANGANLCTVLILERVHLNALQKWIVGRLQVGITCKQQKNGRGFRNMSKETKKNDKT